MAGARVTDGEASEQILNHAAKGVCLLGRLPVRAPGLSGMVPEPSQTAAEVPLSKVPNPEVLTEGNCEELVVHDGDRELQLHTCATRAVRFLISFTLHLSSEFLSKSNKLVLSTRFLKCGELVCPP